MEVTQSPGAGGGPLAPLEAVQLGSELARRRDACTECCGARSELLVRRHHAHRLGRSFLLQKPDDLVVAGVATAGRKSDRYRTRSLAEVERARVEHHSHVVARLHGVGGERGDEPAHRSLAIAPPAIRPGADHVHAVDQEAHQQGILTILLGSTTKLASMRILVVDDERAVRGSVRRALALEGYTVAEAEGGGQALDELKARTMDAVVLDVLMPDVDGLEVCRRLRAAGDRVPVLMLTARESVADRVAGLDAGADDYLVKPFALEELLARLRALLRRTNEAGDGRELRFDGLTLDLDMREARIGGRSIELTRTEFSLLELFMRNPRQVLTRSVINERVWGYDFGPASNSLGVYVGYLRRKLEEEGRPRLIHTMRGVGYVLREAQ